MIVLIGESASGKSTIEEQLVNKGFDKVVSYTTRSMREGEIDGVDYHFISNEAFLQKVKQGFFVEHTNYNGWWYGMAVEDCTDDKVVVLNPHGYRQVKKIEELNVTSFYIQSSWRTRIKRMVDRGDNMMEVFRRIISDDGQFTAIDEEVDFVIDNDVYQYSTSVDRVVEEILDKVKK